MVFPIALALMGAGVYKKHKQDKLDEEEARDELAARKEKREFDRSERNRLVQMRTAVGEASKPLEVTDGTVYQPEVDDEGYAMPANPTAGTFKVGMQRFMDRGAAEQAVAADTPQARMGRIAGVYEQHGDPEAAMRLRTGGMQERSAQLGLDKAEVDFANQKFDSLLAPLMSHDELASTASNSQIGGTRQFKAVVSPDGKTTAYNAVGPDGALVPLPGGVFENTPRGVMLAKQALSKAVPLDQKLGTMHQLEQERLQRDQLAQQERLQTEGHRLTARGQDITARGQDITARGQNMSDARAREANVLKVRELQQSTESGLPVLGVPQPTVTPWANQSNPKDANKVKAAEMTRGAKEVEKDSDVATREAQTAQAAARFIELNKKVNTGGLSDKVGIGRWAQGMGSDYAEMESITARLAPTMREPGSGASSDYDAKQFERATVGVDKPRKTNENIARALVARSQVAQDYADFRRTYLEQNGTLQGADRYWKDYSNKNPIFDPKQPNAFALNPQRRPWRDHFAQGSSAAAPAPAATPAPASPPGGGAGPAAKPAAAVTQLSAGKAGDAEYAALPSGAEFISPDGKRRRKP
jgi:hypothetical protein